MTNSSIPQRTCNVCKQSFPLTSEYWHRDKSAKYGFTYRCKECAKANSRKWVSDNRQRNIENCQTWRQNNPDGFKNWCAENTEHLAEIKRQWRIDNPDKVAQHKKADSIRNRESYRRRSRDFSKRHPEKMRANTLNRIALKRNADGKYTFKDVDRKYHEQQGRCLYCGMTLRGEYHVDHVIPLSRGGSNWPDNLAISCPSCNMSKGNRLLHEWEAVRGW